MTISTAFSIFGTALKKDYVRSHRVAVASSGRRCGLQMVCVEGLDVIGIADRTYLHQLSMEMKHVFDPARSWRSSTFCVIT